jgi:hypothetical protein
MTVCEVPSVTLAIDRDAPKKLKIARPGRVVNGALEITLGLAVVFWPPFIL